MDQTPWWGVPLIAGLFAIGGVVTSQAVAFVLVRRQEYREDRQRWDVNRKELYASFLVASHKMTFALMHNWETSAREETFSEYVDALIFLGEEVRLLASVATKDAAVALYQKTVPIANDPDARRKKNWNDFEDEYLQLVTYFHEAARAELNVPEVPTFARRTGRRTNE
ncbi:hypothetical protein [Micromonospora palythoicola]|uniref:hypothetical protein n=1 Tax=Micromonospora palythoicola TaxID=3120507 RepID=UPI002FCDFDFD